MSYPINKEHQISLILKNINKNTKMIITDSLGYDRRNTEPIIDLAKKLNIDFKQIKLGRSNYYNQPNTSQSWECGIHTYFNTIEIITNKKKKKKELELDKNVDLILEQQFQRQQIVKKIEEENYRNRIKKTELMEAIEELRNKRGNFADKSSKDSLKTVADALQIELWGNLDRKLPAENRNRKPQQKLKKKLRKIEELINEYYKSHPNDTLGIIILTALKTNGNLEGAIKFYENAMFSDTFYFKQHKEDMKSESDEQKLYNIGVVFIFLEKYVLAEEYLKKCLALQNYKYKSSNKEIAETINDIGIILQKKGKYDDSINYFNKALNIRRSCLGERHPKIAESFKNIASVYGEQDRYEESLNLYKRALEIEENSIGRNHKYSAETINLIANTYRYLGNYGKALEFCQEAIKIKEEKLGPNHPFTAYAYNDFAIIFEKLEINDKAITFYEKGLEILKNILGPENSNTINLLNNIASFHKKNGNFEKALEFFRKSIEKFY